VAVRLGDVFRQQLGQLRYEPTPKRIRALVDGAAVVDSTRALLVWEPRRVVPYYAVPQDDVAAELVPGVATGDEPAVVALAPEGSAGPSVPAVNHGAFGRHTAEGEVLTVRIPAGDREGAAFRPADAALAGYVVLDFDAFDRWLEEDEGIVSHPRDPFHRVDVRRSRRSVRIERDGHVLAESGQPHLLFETNLPVRFYLPRADVRTQLLRPSARRTTCAYKGEASYWTAEVGDRTVKDLAWTYERPLPDAAEIAGLVAFFDERVDVVLDGTLRERPTTFWSER